MVPQLNFIFLRINRTIFLLQDYENPQTAIASQKSEISCNAGKFTFR